MKSWLSKLLNLLPSFRPKLADKDSSLQDAELLQLRQSVSELEKQLEARESQIKELLAKLSKVERQVQPQPGSKVEYLTLKESRKQTHQPPENKQRKRSGADSASKKRDRQLQRAETCMEGRNFSQALEILNAILSKEPLCVHALVKRAKIRVETNKPFEAIEDYSRIINAGLATPEVYSARGNAFFNLGDEAQALRDRQAAKEMYMRILPK